MTVTGGRAAEHPPLVEVSVTKKGKWKDGQPLWRKDHRSTNLQCVDHTKAEAERHARMHRPSSSYARTLPAPCAPPCLFVTVSKTPEAREPRPRVHRELGAAAV